jgi:asparagine synthase (glutamine-hydrolysing)
MRTFRKVHEVMKEYRESDVCRRLQRFDITRQLASHFLMKEDHGTMAHSIEARVPYLDRSVVEFAYSLPRSFKCAGEWFRFGSGQEKRILRHVASRYLPHEIAFRKKRGFMIPMPEVLKSNPAKVRDYLQSAGSLARERFSAREIDRMLRFRSVMYSPFDKHKEFLVWKLFLMEAWRRQYIGVSRQRGALAAG